MDRDTILAVDWSKHGVGFMLLQKTCKCEKADNHRCCATGWVLILAGGRFTTPSESRYSPVEGEALAIVEGLEGTKDYILGMKNLVVATDHNPLIGVFKKPLGEIDNPRLLNLVQKTLWYQFRVVHVPGKENPGPDFSPYKYQRGESVPRPGKPS